jgi:O-antigen/teichoic acid export membrane protein
MVNQRKVGVILSYINMFLGIVLGLINVKIILHFVSLGDYGVYVLLGSLIAVMGVLDLGFAGTMIRYYTKSLTLEDKVKQENTLATGTLIYGAIALIVIVSSIVIYPLIQTLYKVSFTASELVLVSKLYFVMIINFVLSISTNVYNAAITAHERFVFINLLDVVKAIMNPILVYVLLFYTKSVMTVVIIHTTINILGIIVKIIYAHTKLKIKIKLHFFDKELFAAITTFAFFIFLNMIMDRIYWQTDNLILGAVAGSVAIAIYGNASALTRYYLNFSSQIASVFLPKITTISAKTDDMTELNGIFLKVGRIQYIIIMLILSGFIIFGKEFIIAWVGPRFIQAYDFALILMIPLVVPLIQNTGISILQAKNKHRFRSIVYFFIAVLNFALSIPLAKLYGGYGCAAATAGSLIIGQWVIINIYYKNKIGLEIGKFFKSIAMMSLPMVIVGVLGFYINTFMIVDGFLLLVPKILVYAVIYFLIVGKFSFNDYERGTFLGLFNKVLRRKSA